MYYNYACGYRRRKSPELIALDDRMHQCLVSGDMNRYLCAHSHIYKPEPKPRKPSKPARRCPCGQPVLAAQYRYCLDHQRLTQYQRRKLFNPRPSRRKLNAEKVRQIKHKLAEGYTRRVLAREFGVGYHMIRLIELGRLWNGVE